MDFFPTVHIAYDFKKKNQLYASYGRRIERPRSSMLEPFFTWNNAFNISRGNPELIPEYIDSYELGFLKKFNKNLIAIESYYRISHNKIEDIYGVFKENIMFNTPENVGQDFSLGIDFTFSYRLFKWWDFDLLGNFFNYRVKGQLVGFDFSNGNNSWSSRFNNTFKIYKGTKIQINSMYNGPIVDAQGRFEGYFRLNAAIKTSLWDSRVNAVLEFRDVFSTLKYEYNSEGPRFNSSYKRQATAPQIRFSISYQFDNQ
jgi:outer membrane receptor protein involved in Fe transport